MDKAAFDPNLLTTKLAIPHPYQKNIIARTGIYNRLDAGLQSPLLLVSAAAGFGKTTLVSSWLRERQYSAAWVSLESTDNDVVRFWRYVVTALQQVHPALSQVVANWQATTATGNIEMLLTDLINELMNLQTDLLLVLDDYHTIVEPAIQQSLTFFLEHLPQRVHLLLCTRCDPPLPLARLRVQGRVVEVHAAELRFNEEETHLFLTQTIGLQLTPEQCRELFVRTEGWVAGLQLASLSLQHKTDPTSVAHFIASFNGTNRHIMTYLSDEVLAYQPEEIQEFLLQTSILERLQSSLCDAVTGQRNAEQMLERLEQEKLFLVALDHQQQWYRYERLFVELLRYRLKQQVAMEAAELHQRASQWYEQHSMLSEAIAHALQAQDSERASSIIEQHAFSFMQNGNEMLVYTWLADISEAVIRPRPMLSFLYACALLYKGHIEEYQEFLHNAERLWQQEKNMKMLGYVCDVQATVALLKEDSEQALRQAQETLAYAEEGDYALRSHALTKLGAAYLQLGELAQAQVYITDGYRSSQKQTNTYSSLQPALYIADMQIAQGNLRSACQTLQRMLSTTGEMLPWHQVAVHIRLGSIYREWNDLVNAHEQCQHALKKSEQLPQNGFANVQRFVLAAQLARLNGDNEYMQHLLEYAEQSAQHLGFRHTIIAQATELRVRQLLSQGDQATAQRWFEQYHTQSGEQSVVGAELWQRIQARLLIAQERTEEAIDILQEQHIRAQQQGRVDSAIALLILLTLAYHSQGITQKTMQTLEQALFLAEPGGYTRIFVDEGEIMAALLTELYSRYQRRGNNEPQGISLSYVYTILSAFGEDAPPPIWLVTQDQDDTLIDKLSEREYMVLALIAEGLSNQEIAHKLVVTISTVKTHLNNIYAKLHVHTRLQAVTKAHNLGLLRRSEVDTEPLAHPHSSERI